MIYPGVQTVVVKPFAELFSNGFISGCHEGLPGFIMDGEEQITDGVEVIQDGDEEA